MPTTKHQDKRLAAAVSAWFQTHARDLPWRTLRRDPYHSLVAEAMLQQTQVSRVIEKYTAFIERFPTVHSLAAADEQDVLAMWSGLGYYRRARHLHAAAKMIVAEFAGRVPSDVESLLRLPGVGRYTAGSLSSIVHGLPAPIVDGNVARVLLRIHGKSAAANDRAIQPWLWQRAESLILAAKDPGAFNEGLMELGATICAPAPSSPRCNECPLAADCAVKSSGRQLQIPRPTVRIPRRTIYCAVALVRRTDGAVLVEQRDAPGMWAGMWQAPTIERSDRPPAPDEIAHAIGAPARDLRESEPFEFLATHRRMVFRPHTISVPKSWTPRRGQFVRKARLAGLPMGSPQRRILLPSP